MVLSRGMVALVFLVLLLGFSFTTIIIDPLHESNEVPVRVGMSPHGSRSEYAGVTVVVVSTETPKMKSSVTELCFQGKSDFIRWSNVTVSSSDYSPSMESESCNVPFPLPY